MGKLIFFLVIIIGIYFLFFKRKIIKKETKDLVMCDQCKTFYPEDEIKKINKENICKECYANTK